MQYIAIAINSILSNITYQCKMYYKTCNILQMQNYANAIIYIFKQTGPSREVLQAQELIFNTLLVLGLLVEQLAKLKICNFRL